MKIEQTLVAQATSWNRGDIDSFMKTYWNSQDLSFSSGGKTTKGWKATRDRYYQRYPDRAAMGRLTFSKLETTVLGDSSAMVLGRWNLERTAKPQNLKGNFTLVLRRFKDDWLIIHDHTSLEPPVDKASE